MFYCVRLPGLQSGNRSESNIFFCSTICLMTGNIDIYFLFFFCGESLESNIGLVIKKPNLSQHSISVFPTERLAGRSRLSRRRRRAERGGCSLSRKCQDNNVKKMSR